MSWGQPLGLAAGSYPGPRDGDRDGAAGGGVLSYRERSYHEPVAQAQARCVDPYDCHDGVLMFV